MNVDIKIESLKPYAKFQSICKPVITWIGALMRNIMKKISHSNISSLNLIKSYKKSSNGKIRVI